MRVCGIDGCPAGWVVVSIGADGARDFAIIDGIDPRAISDAAMTYIDMPIGLPESGHRGCDLAARKLLGRAQSRVFLGLRRPLLAYLGDYPAANAWAKTDGKGLAKQAFFILPKIAEIDAIMTPARQRRLRESHPELVFQRLNGGTPLVSKHARAGLEARHKILARHGFEALGAWLGQLRGRGAQPDDLLDACALALAAREASQGNAQRVKCSARRDARGLRMDIWF